VEAADQEAVALVLEVLKDRARVLAHQDGVRRVVVNAELVAHAVPLADAVERNPRSRRVGDVVVPVVAGGPARHRTLLDAIGEPAILGGFQQRNEVLLEVDEVLVHAALLVAADESAHRVDAEQRRRVEDAQQEVVLLLAGRRIVVQQVVEVGEVRQAHAGIGDGGEYPRRARPIERLPEVKCVGHRIEHRFGRHVGLRRVQGGRQLDVAGANLERELQPVFDGAVRIGVAHLARRQLLERGRQHSHPHELRLKGRQRSTHTRVQAPPSSALARMASTIRLAWKPSSKVATIGAIGG
jgi:hypothetical protein